MIHPTSIVSPKAKIGKDVVIGPFCRIYDNVTIGDGCFFDSHVVIGSQNGEVTIGSENKFYGFSLIGGPPQDLKYKGEPTKLVVGDKNTFRESVTVSIGTSTGGGTTMIGSGNLFMAYCHVGHDVLIGSNNVLANLCQLAGHVVMEDKITLGAMSAVNQFVRIGKYAFAGGASMINKDIPPYVICQGDHAVIRATNKIGLERAGFNEEQVSNINRAVRILTKGGGTVEEALSRIADECTWTPEIEYFAAFIKGSKRGLAL
ncbi:MAG: acyl-ACP--UDP-N-acetylglucosamine O-acyltransferase [Oligoflexia bacterium]|nr:acyl-ACP--UDP-N-acetylglucosamine O-acyltransferase [Oligoflexia bacterium]